MKSLSDLQKIRDAAKKSVDMRETKDGFRVAVGMATCGIAAGARPILNAFVEKVGEKNLDNVIVTQVGCIGECAFEPIVEIFDRYGDKTTYALVNRMDIVDDIIEQHIVNGKKVEKYLLNNLKK